MKLFLVINFVTFQLCWFIAASYQQSGLFVMAVLLAIHLFFSPKKMADINILVIALIGVVVDQLLIIFQVLQIPEGSSLTAPLIIPIWLIFIWCIFAWSLNHSLHWLVKLPVLKVSIIGGVFGALSYYAALQLTVFTSILSPTYFALAMAVIWAFLLPLFTRLQPLLIKEDVKY